ncbi:MAG: serine hydrolase [Jatrophihabitans sp.]
MARSRVAIIVGVLVLLLALVVGVRSWWPDSAPAAIDPPVSSSTLPTSTPATSTPASSTPASSTPARTPSAAPTSTSRSPAVTAAALTASLAALFGPGDSFSATALDLTTGHSIGVGAAGGMTEASIVKLDILQAWLYQQQRAGGGLDQDETSDVTAMIEHSDNAAADQVFRDIDGNAGLSLYNRAVGMSATRLDTNGNWGLSTTSAADQLRLLKALVSAGSPLTSASRSYALGLMGKVEADQTWGVSAPADPESTVQLKNGWLNIDSDRGLWAVNSGGVATVKGHRLLLVVLSQHQPDFRTGVRRVEAAAVKLAAALS